MRRNTLKSSRPGVRRQILRAKRARERPSNANTGQELSERERQYIQEVREIAARVRKSLPKKSTSGKLALMVAHTIYENPSNPAISAIQRIIETPKAEQIIPPKAKQKMPARPEFKTRRKRLR